MEKGKEKIEDLVSWRNREGKQNGELVNNLIRKCYRKKLNML